MAGPFLAHWEVAKIDGDHFIGIVQDIEMNWHAAIGTKGKRWPDPPYPPDVDKERAKGLAYVYYQSTALAAEPHFKLPQYEKLDWQKEPTPIWVPFHLNRN